MFDEFENEPDSWRPDLPKWVVILKKSVEYFFGLLIFSIIAFLIIRVISSQPPKAMKEAVWDERLYSAYTQNKELEIVQLPTQSSFSESSMFSVYTILYCPEIKQLQLTVRYNDRVLNYLTEDYPEAQSLIDSGSEVYTYHLTYKKDGVPHTAKGYSYVSDHKAGYTYRRLIFNDIDISGIAGLTVNAAYVGRPDTPREVINAFSDGGVQIPFDYKKPKGVTKNIKIQEVVN